MPKTTLAILVPLLLVACGDDDAGGGAATTADETALCAADCGRTQRCAPSEYSASCPGDCAADLDAPLYLHGFFVAYTACIDDLACNTSDDACLLEGLVAVNASWETDPMKQTCDLRHATCGSFSDDYCASAAALSPAGEDALGACLDEDCGAISACLEASF